MLCPADTRIQDFLDSYLSDVNPQGAPRLPADTFVLDRPGLARVMSLPAGEDSYSSPYLKSYRVQQGVLHNPKSDRRTTQGIFHIVEGGLPIPADKIAVPKQRILQTPRRRISTARTTFSRFRSPPISPNRSASSSRLLLRPVICPATGSEPAKTMETRFFAPASLVSNLDFVEGIFGNAGDPYLPENDAALDVEHWSGHTGCVILAPHLMGFKKKDLGLPYSSEDEAYNGGEAFKLTCRDQSAVSSSPSLPTTITAIARKKSKRRSATPPTCSDFAKRNTRAAPSHFPLMCSARSSMPGAPFSPKKSSMKTPCVCSAPASN